MSDWNDEDLLPLKLPENLSSIFIPFLFVNVFVECCPKQLHTWENFALLWNISCFISIIQMNSSCAFSCFLQKHMATIVWNLLKKNTVL